MAGGAANQDVGFGHDKVGGDEQAGSLQELSIRLTGNAVMLVASITEGNPGTGIDKDIRSGHRLPVVFLGNARQVVIVLFCKISESGVEHPDNVPKGIVFEGHVGEEAVNALSDELGDGNVAPLGQGAQRLQLLWAQVDLDRLLQNSGHACITPLDMGGIYITNAMHHDRNTLIR